VLARLLTGILAVVFLPLGITFAIVSGAGVGAPFLAVGAAFAAVFLALLRKERGRRARRQLRATAEVVSSKINHGVQLNAKRQLVLTVRIPGAGEASGSFFWLPSNPVGERIDVLYDPADPSNFEPVE
jgi:hypothetical protein